MWNRPGPGLSGPTPCQARLFLPLLVCFLPHSDLHLKWLSSSTRPPGISIRRPGCGNTTPWRIRKVPTAPPVRVGTSLQCPLGQQVRTLRALAMVSRRAVPQPKQSAWGQGALWVPAGLSHATGVQQLQLAMSRQRGQVDWEGLPSAACCPQKRTEPASLTRHSSGSARCVLGDVGAQPALCPVCPPAPASTLTSPTKAVHWGNLSSCPAAVFKAPSPLLSPLETDLAATPLAREGI